MDAEFKLRAMKSVTVSKQRHSRGGNSWSGCGEMGRAWVSREQQEARHLLESIKIQSAGL